MKTSARVALPAALAFVVAAACGPAHVGSYTPKKRDYATPTATSADAAPSPGSLWRDTGPGASLYSDARALRVNDLVVVKVEEIADAKRATDTDISRSGGTTAAINAFLGAVKTPKTIDASSETTFKGSGSTARSEHLVATVPAIVRKVMPNGNLFIEGHRVVLVNAEEQHFYISGVVRPIDIDQENAIKSSQVADAEIEFTGRGVLTDNQRQGWASRWFGWIWPF
jgi:flagellar L-ring protein precursor FlgH